MIYEYVVADFCEAAPGVEPANPAKPWYVARTEPEDPKGENSDYLHDDGVWRKSAIAMSTSAYYATEAEAQAMLEKHK